MSTKEELLEKLQSLQGDFTEEDVEHIKNLSFTNNYTYNNPIEYCEFINGYFKLEYQYKEKKIKFVGTYELNQTYDNRCDPYIDQQYQLFINDKMETDYTDLEDFNANNDPSLFVIGLIVDKYKYNPTDLMKI